MHGSSSPRLLYALITYNLATEVAVNTSYGLEAHIIEDLHFVELNTVCIIVNYVLVAWQIFNALRDQHAIQLW
jgi:hypothetical protein